MLCVCQVFRNSLVFEVGIYVCRHNICVCLCVICMPSQIMPDVFYLSDSPASWWRFAFNVVLSRVTEHTRRQTWAFVASRAQLNVRYVRAYTQKLTDPVLDTDMSVSCHLCVSAASLCVPMSRASLCVPMHVWSLPVCAHVWSLPVCAHVWSLPVCAHVWSLPVCAHVWSLPVCAHVWSLPVCAHVWSLPVCVNVRRTFTCLPVLFRLFPFELFSVGGGWL